MRAAFILVRVKDMKRKYTVGQLVRRSKHWQEQSFLKGTRQLGIVTDVTFYPHEKDKRRVVEWPVVHWVGGHMGSITHPMNVDVVTWAANQPKVQS
jgi:hypothetical protein